MKIYEYIQPLTEVKIQYSLKSSTGKRVHKYFHFNYNFPLSPETYLFSNYAFYDIAKLSNVRVNLMTDLRPNKI